MLPSTLGLVALLLWALGAAAGPAVLLGVLPSSLPVNTTGLSLQLYLAPAAGTTSLDSSYQIDFQLPGNAGVVSVNASLGKVYSVEAPAVSVSGTALLRVAGSLLPPLALYYYDPPVFSGVVRVNNASTTPPWSVGSSGFDIMTLGLSAASPDVNVPQPLILASCAWQPVLRLGGASSTYTDIVPQALSSGYVLHRPVLHFNADGSVATASLTLDDLSPSNLALSTAAGTAAAALTNMTVSQVLSDVFNASSVRGYGSIFEYNVGATLVGDGAGGRALMFETSQLPADACPTVSLFVSVNGGITAHYTGVTASLAYRAPLKVASLYPYTIAASPFVAAHNQARVKTASLFNGALDMSTYYESAWAVPALETGTLIAPASFNTSIAVDGASFIVCAGTQFSATAKNFSQALPNLRVLVMSTLRSAPSSTANRNLVQTTGRMYEAMFVAGVAAGATTRTGRLGFLMAINQPTSYAFVNAFYLGAVYAAETGAARPGLRPEHIKVSAFIVGSFSNSWAEENAAIDLLDGRGDQAIAVGAAEAAPVVATAASASQSGPAALPSRSSGIDVLFPVTDSPIPQLECHKRGCVSLGFNADERLALGDSVILSTVFDWGPIYIRYARRIITGSPFYSPSEDGYAGGMGAGVDVSSLSPVVPLSGRKATSAMADTLRSGTDASERIFCSGLLLDSSDTVRLNATAAWLALLATGGPAANETRYGRGSSADPVVNRFSGPLTAAAAAQLLASGTVSTSKFGERGAPLACLRRSDVYSMTWTLKGVKAVTYTPPPVPVAAQVPVWRLAGDASTLSELTIPAALTILLSLMSAVLVLACRRASPFKYSSPLFLLVLLAGTMLFSIWLLVVAWVLPDDTDTVCTATPWVMGTAFALTYGSLFAKTYRIHRLFNNRKLKRLRITARYVLNLVAGIVVAELLLVLVLELLFPRGILMKRSVTGPSDSPVIFPVCSAISSSATTNPPDGFVILNAAQLLLLVWGSWCAFRTRNVPLAFNESRWIAVSIYVFILCEIVAITVSAAFSVAPAMQYTAYMMRGGISPLLTVLAIFGPKAYAVCTGKARDSAAAGSEDVVIGRGKVAAHAPGARLPRVQSSSKVMLRAEGSSGGSGFDGSSSALGGEAVPGSGRSSGLVSGVSRGIDFINEEPPKRTPASVPRLALGGRGAGSAGGPSPGSTPVGDAFSGDEASSTPGSASPMPLPHAMHRRSSPGPTGQLLLPAPISGGPSSGAGDAGAAARAPAAALAPPARPAAGFRAWFSRLTRHSTSSGGSGQAGASPHDTFDSDSARGHQQAHGGSSSTSSSNAGGGVVLRDSRLKMRVSDVSVGAGSGSMTFHPVHHASEAGGAAADKAAAAGAGPAGAEAPAGAPATTGGKIRKFVRIASGNKLVSSIGEPAGPAPPAAKPSSGGSSGRSSARVAPAPPATGGDSDTRQVWSTLTHGNTVGQTGGEVSVDDAMDPTAGSAAGGGAAVVVTVFSDSRSADKRSASPLTSGGGDGAPTQTSQGRQQVVTTGVSEVSTPEAQRRGDEARRVDSTDDSFYDRDDARTIDPLADTTTTNGWGLTVGVNTVTATDAL